MKIAANRIVFLLVGLIGAAVACGGPAHEIAVEGSADRLWVAEVVHVDDLVQSTERTRVFWRAVPADGWQRPMLVGAGVRDLAHRGTQLVAQLKTGEWMFVWPEGRSSGPALPGNEMVCVGGDGTTVWAVGRVPGGVAGLAARTPATGPTTRETNDPAVATTRVAAATVTTAPTTGPVKLVLFRLERSDWVTGGELPDAIPTTVDRLSIEVVRGRIYLAAIVGGDAVVYERDGVWSEAGRFHPQGTPFTRAKVLDGGDRPIVWVAGPTGAGTLYQGAAGHGHAWAKPVELRVKADLSQPLPRDVTVVAQRIQMVFGRGEKLFVQAFDWRTGEPKGEPVAITSGTASGPDAKFGFWLNAAVMTVLLMVMVAAMRRRGVIEDAVRRVDRIPLAPLTLRFAAGLVDLWPQWVAAVYLSMRPDAPTDLEASLTDPVIVRAGMAAMVVYILHTMAMEMTLGASIGKFAFGLRVVQLDGGRPGLGSMFVRNLMRAVDVGMVFVGAMMIVMSPLRQRIGDLAAGTIVVRRTGVKEEVPEEEFVSAEKD